MSQLGSSHSVGQNEVFHNHSYNIPHLSSWIDEIIQLTENSLPAKANPTTEELVEGISRYDACFREMLKQTNIFSPDLTRIYSKLWIGVLELLDNMVKIYHRHVVQTASLQDQARDLIHQRQAQVAATKIKQEEDILERTGLRATIRNLEGEIVALKGDNRELDRENRALRALVETYIDARDFDPALLELVTAGKEKDGSNAAKRTIMESGKFQIDQVNKLDVEMNELLSSIQKEEDRQSAVFSQFSELLERNESLLMTMSADKSLHSGTATTVHDLAIQVDEKTHFGLIGDVDEVAVEDIPDFPPGDPVGSLEEKGLSVPYILRRHMTSFPRVLRIPSLDWTKQVVMSIYMAKIRYDMKFEGEVLAMGKLSLPEFVYAHYQEVYGLSSLTDMQVMVLLRACQYHANTSKRVFLFASQLGLFRPEEPPDLDKRDTDLILTMIRSLSDQGELQVQHSHESQTQKASIAAATAVATAATAALQNHPLSKQPSSSKLIRQNSSSRQNPASMSRQNSRDETLTARGAAVSSKDGEEGKSDGQRADPFNQTLGSISPYVKRTSALFSAQNIFSRWLPDQSNEYLMKVRAMPNVKGSFHIDFDDFLEVTMEQWALVRAIWVDHITELYTYSSSIYRVVSEVGFATDKGTPEKDVVLVQMIRDPSIQLQSRKLHNFSEASHTAFAAAMDKLIIYERNQAQERQLAEDTLMASSSGNRRASRNKRLSFSGIDSTDGKGVAESKSVSSSMAGALATAATVVPTMVPDTGRKDAPVEDEGNEGGGGKDNVVDLITKKNFVNAMKAMLPTLTPQEMSLLFEAAQEMFFQRTKRELESLWVSVHHPIANRPFYVNKVTKHTQWTCPYRLNTYYPYDVDKDSFIDVVLEYLIIDRSPLLEYFHVNPHDLWPNTEVFYRELEISRRRGSNQSSRKTTTSTSQTKKKVLLHKQETV